MVVIEGTGHAGRRRRHRPLERARGGHARCAGDHRQRGRHRAADRRDRAQPRALRRARRARCSARWSTRSTSSRTRTCRRCCDAGWRSTGSSCSAASRTREFLANPSLELIVTHLDGELLSGRGDARADDRLGGHRRDAGGPRRGAAARPDAAHHAGRSRGPAARRGRGQPRCRATPRVIGIVLTGGFRPSEPVLGRAARRPGMFAYLVGTDTYRTAQAVDEILVKTHAVGHGEDRDDHRAGRRRARRRRAAGSSLARRAARAEQAKGGRTWAPAGLPCTATRRGRGRPASR